MLALFAMRQLSICIISHRRFRRFVTPFSDPAIPTFGKRYFFADPRCSSIPFGVPNGSIWMSAVDVFLWRLSMAIVAASRLGENRRNSFRRPE
jgi:hypothetical protein